MRRVVGAGVEDDLHAELVEFGPPAAQAEFVVDRPAGGDDEINVVVNAAPGERFPKGPEFVDREMRRAEAHTVDSCAVGGGEQRPRLGECFLVDDGDPVDGAAAGGVGKGRGFRRDADGVEHLHGAGRRSRSGDGFEFIFCCVRQTGEDRDRGADGAAHDDPEQMGE